MWICLLVSVTSTVYIENDDVYIKPMEKVTKRSSVYKEDPLEPGHNEVLEYKVFEDPLEPLTSYIEAKETQPVVPNKESATPMPPFIIPGPGQTEQVDASEVYVLRARLSELKHDLATEKDRAQRWQTMFVAERTTREHQSQQQQEAVPNFITCVSLLLPQFNLQELSHLSSDGINNMAQHLKQQWAFFQNISSDAAFTQVLMDKWEELQKYAESPTITGFTQQAMHAYDDLQKTLGEKWAEFQKVGQPKSESPKSSATNSSPLHDYMNRTKATVSRLSDTLHDTWVKVKNLSSDFLKRHEETIMNVQESVKVKVSQIGQKVQSKLEKVKYKFQKHGLFLDDVLSKEAGKKGQSKNRQFSSTHRRPHSKHSDGSFHYNEAYPGGKFEDKPNHRKKDSSHEHDNYEEFWNKAGFDPDDIEQDGFFEGNNREWRKHQKKLKNLHGRIHRLNEDILTSMDDDDIEDLYDDLEDFDDDIEDEEQHGRLKTWLTCQLRWWKSRFQRKHRNQDMIRGCGKQLMHWQLRALCKTDCKGRKCKKEVKQTQFLCAQILQTNSFHTQGKCHGDKCQKLFDIKYNKKYKTNKGFQNPKTANVKMSAYNDDPNQQYINPTSHTFFEVTPSNVEEMVNATTSELLDGDSAQWYFKRVQGREDKLVDSEWYFQRMESRDGSRHDSSWYLKSMYEKDARSNEYDSKIDDIPLAFEHHHDHHYQHRYGRHANKWSVREEQVFGSGGRPWRRSGYKKHQRDHMYGFDNNQHQHNKWECNNC